MAYSIQRNGAAGFALVTFSGGVRPEERADALGELEALVAETGWRRVLVDFSSSRYFVAMTTDQALRHARGLANLSTRWRDLRIAYVFPPEQPPVVELLAASRGFAFERFDDRHAALEWLASDSEAMRIAA